jgi:nucleotide-binding universal stress UspA family protein
MPQSKHTALPKAQIKRILVPTDFSAGAEPALTWAAKLTECFGAEVVLLHVLDMRLAALAGLPPDMAAMPAVDELVKSARSEADEQMKQLVARLPGAKTIIKEGPPRTVILEVAADLRADLVVMGTHGRTGLAHAFFGSVAEYVVRHSRIPVLTARQKDRS